jgi:hypothetical protein
LFLQRHADKLVIIDEVQRLPGLFAELRGLIDAGQRKGRPMAACCCSAPPRWANSAEQRIPRRPDRFLELCRLHAVKLGADVLDTLWNRGDFLGSVPAATDGDSGEWRRQFIRIDLEHVIPSWCLACLPKPCAASGPCSPMARVRCSMPPKWAGRWAWTAR